MRETYHVALNSVIDDLVAMTDRVQTAVRDATKALLAADLATAERVITADAELDLIHDDIENRCFSLLARQAPVAGELRTVVAALRMVADLVRMGDLSAHVAKIARLRYPDRAVPAGLVESFTKMAEVAEEMVETAGHILRDRNANAALEVADSDEEMDDLRRGQFRVLLGAEWPYTVEAAVDVALLGRYYERIADHAVLMARRVIFLVTGTVPEGENWTTA